MITRKPKPHRDAHEFENPKHVRPMAGFEDSDSDLLLYADEAPHRGEPAGGTWMRNITPILSPEFLSVRT